MPKVIAKAFKAAFGLVLSPLLSLFGATKLPKQPSTQVPIKQPVAPRVSAFGRVRRGGLYVLFEAVDKVSVDVLALLSGRSQGFVQWYLNDDAVELGLNTAAGVYSPDGKKYTSDSGATARVFIYSRLGLPTETAYAEVTALYPAWDADHRGDGVTSMALTCRQSKAKHQSEDFPNGKPEPSVILDSQLIYDPRDGGQVQGDKDTYVYSNNPALCLLAYMTDAEGGMGLDYDRHFLPAIDTWIAAADDCDLDEATEDGTEPRYRCGGSYEHDNDPGDIVKAILGTFDGFMAPRGDGAFVLWPGRYQAPTVTLTDRHVKRYSLTHYLPDERATNQYRVSFTDPNADMKKGDAGVVEDSADITARGVIRSASLDLDWVQSASQAIRLGKRKLAREVQPLRGTITANLMGLQVLGERYVRLQLSDNPSLADLVVEITSSPEVDPTNLTVEFSWIAADVDIDGGDPGGEVVIPPTPDPRPTSPALDPPVIDTLTAIYDDSAAGIAGARIQANITPPTIAEADVQWVIRWRKQGATDWTEEARDDIDDGAAVTLVTGFVAATGTIEVQVAYLTAAQTSPWSDTETIALATPSILSKTIAASEDITAPALVNVHNSSGAKVRKADATAAGKEANGFILASVLSGANATVYFEGPMTGLSSLTPGARYYLHTTPGAVTSAAPSTSGNIVQPIGVAVSATEIDFEAGQSVELA